MFKPLKPFRMLRKPLELTNLRVCCSTPTVSHYEGMWHGTTQLQDTSVPDISSDTLKSHDDSCNRHFTHFKLIDSEYQTLEDLKGSF